MSKLNYLRTAIALPVAFGVLGTYGHRVNATNTIQVSCDTSTSIPTIAATLSNSDKSSGDVDRAFQTTHILSFLPEYFSTEEASFNCQKTAASLQSYYSKGVMNYLASDTIDGKPVVCAVERRGVSCDGYSSEILFSLDRAVNPNQLLYDMLGEDFKSSQSPSYRTLSRTYTDLRPTWWPF
ncbi:hypothetical protein I4641_03245 [Waterburya agarophytonicola K14]|uniref:Uncharacterized protein n=1 Tax=Waterburya agarophytonicola KI4 TaxID=2874699 RepID=A0A964BPX4_9CYAN|nr:COP23 domain-containing protein [Waterburya agarophytonicola]MCC0175996.1 hypothetical protein [Waterburya agarophytonicola KI4]